MNVQIYGSNKSKDTKKALRFFKERGIKPQFFDLKKHIMSKGELNRFIQKSKLEALINKDSKYYKEAGLEFMRISDESMLDRLIDEYELMTQPLVRSGNVLTVGWDEVIWKAWVKEQKSQS